MTAFFRILDVDVDDKADALKAAIREGSATFEVASDTFAQIPGSPFAYWVGPAINALFKRFPRLETATRVARAGGQTSDDGRYLRAWWEVPARSSADWRTYVKGGAPSSFYVDQPLVASWDSSRSTFPGFLGRPGRASEKPSNVELYFLPGITWPLRASRFAPQYMPANSIFTVRGYAIIEPVESIGATIALTSSAMFDFLAKLLLGRFEFPEFVVGAIQQIPLPPLTAEASAELGRHARRAWSLKRALDMSTERSHSFLLPQILHEKVAKFDRGAVEDELQQILKKIDDAAFSLYGIGDADRASVEASRRTVSSGRPVERPDEDDEAVDDSPTGSNSDELVSWLVGVAFGRFDARLATCERGAPPEPEPFDAMPSRSPGMYPEGEEPADRPDILVDDAGHPDDIAARSGAVAENVHVEALEHMRPWVAKEFFAAHIKMYSKSGRRAPIYWQLATPSASYSLWLYIHAFTRDTLFRVQNDYVAPKVAHEERRLEAARREGGFTDVTEPRPYEEKRQDRARRDLGSPDDGSKSAAARRKELDAQEVFVDELRALLAEVKLVTPLWIPHLDDGVVINAAPLWRLFPHHKPWQKELKSTWDSLCAGDFDWSHMAMHLWPERVVPKCASDRSLAIAHGLEEAFWVEGADGKWQKRERPNAAVHELVKGRTSAAVKEALKSLLEAPMSTSAGRGRGAAKRSARASTGGDS